MIENKMKEVAKLLGLELEEEFNIEGFPTKFKFTERGFLYWSNTDKRWCNTSGIPDKLLTGEHNIVKLPKPVLTDAEKEYLGNIIKPFRDRIICIKKYEDPQDEYLGIHLKYYANETDSETIVFPSFGKRTMYKGMEVEKEYTLEELGL